MIKKLVVRKPFISFILLAWASFGFTQNCPEDARFTEIDYFSVEEIDSLMDVTYGAALNVSDEMEDLKMDIYFPKNEIDPMDERPFVLLIHGGAFISGDKSSMQLDAREFAKKGFVAATMNYRLGWTPSLSNQYRAAQDAFAALRYISHHSTEMEISTNQFFIGGYSAGSITTLNMVFYQQEEWNSWIDNLEEDLGSLHTSGNEWTDSYTLLGMLNHAGFTYTSTVSEEEMIPSINFHGTLDPIVPIDNGLNGQIGTRPLHYMYEEAGICSEMNVKPLAGHLIYTDYAGALFKVHKTVCFFRSILCDNCASSYTEDPQPANCSESLEVSEITEEIYTISPNPFQDYLSIQTDEKTNHIEIFTIEGRLVFSGNSIQNINFSHLVSGYYVLKLKTEREQKSFSILKK